VAPPTSIIAEVVGCFPRVLSTLIQTGGVEKGQTRLLTWLGVIGSLPNVPTLAMMLGPDEKRQMNDGLASALKAFPPASIRSVEEAVSAVRLVFKLNA